MIELVLIDLVEFNVKELEYDQESKQKTQIKRGGGLDVDRQSAKERE